MFHPYRKIDEHRKHERFLKHRPNLVAARPVPEDPLQTLEQKDFVETLMTKVPTSFKQREMLLMAQQGRTKREIARAMGISRTSVFQEFATIRKNAARWGGDSL